MFSVPVKSRVEIDFNVLTRIGKIRVAEASIELTEEELKTLVYSLKNTLDLVRNK